MKKQKGFTLIELLAVIVILGLITIVAVPKILDVINKSKESATSSSIKLVKDAIKTQVASSNLTGPVFTKEKDGCYLFDFDDQESGNAKSLEIKNKDKVSGSIKYCNNTFSDDTLKFNGNSISKEETKGKIICKRATILHTEECTQTDATYYCSGAGYTTSGSKGTATITYGNLGTPGVLTSGDAFDCDVNGDGVYDASTERFYYVSDYYDTNTKSFDSNYATLIYYNNVSSGKPNANGTAAYDSSKENWHGPRTAIVQLPTSSQWNNVSLKNSTRAILNENGENTTTGGTLPSNYNYVGYSARFLTIQEIRKGTDINNIPTWETGEFDNFTYLLENTRFASDKSNAWVWWLENPLSDLFTDAWRVSGSYRNIGKISASDDHGVRPAIEVSKTNIEY